MGPGARARIRTETDRTASSNSTRQATNGGGPAGPSQQEKQQGPQVRGERDAEYHRRDVAVVSKDRDHSRTVSPITTRTMRGRVKRGGHSGTVAAIAQQTTVASTRRCLHVDLPLHSHPARAGIHGSSLRCQRGHGGTMDPSAAPKSALSGEGFVHRHVSRARRVARRCSMGSGTYTSRGETRSPKTGRPCQSLQADARRFERRALGLR